MNKQDTFASGVIGALIGYALGGPSGSALGFFIGLGAGEAAREKEKFRWR